MILNKFQAEAIFSAMCALNNVGGALSATIEGIRVEETHSGAIQVWQPFGVSNDYEKHAFATVYGLHK